MPYFFLSSAPDEDEIFVERFFRDLSSEVKERAGLGSTIDIGFSDHGSGDGQPWPGDVRTALTTCQTFVALCSPAYFLSDRAGRAWHVFADRLRRHTLSTGTPLPALIPVIWSNDGLPADAFEEDGVFIEPHRTPGNEDLRVLVRLRSHRSAYRAVVASVAHRIVETADAQRLAPSPPGLNLENVVSAFERQPRWSRDEHRPRHVNFLIAAGTREQMESIRNDLQFYGERREDWSPYRPVTPQPLALIARGIAARCALESGVAGIDKLAEHLRSPRRDDEIVVVLVDAWATQVESVSTKLRDVDRDTGSGVAILVSLSRDDPETVRHRPRLAAAIGRTFPVAADRHETFSQNIGTVTQFDDELVRVLAAANARLRHRRRPGQGPARRPILGGP
jgi:FxsC-like protein